MYGNDAPWVEEMPINPDWDVPTWDAMAQDKHAYSSVNRFRFEDPEMYKEYMRLLVKEFGPEAANDPERYAGPQRYAEELQDLFRAKSESADDAKPVASGSKQAAKAKGKARAKPVDEDSYVGARDASESDAASSSLSDDSDRKGKRKASQRVSRPKARQARDTPAPAAAEDTENVGEREGKSMAAIRRARMQTNEVDNSSLFEEDEEDVDNGGPPPTSIGADEDETPPADIVPARAAPTQMDVDTPVAEPQRRLSSPVSIPPTSPRNSADNGAGGASTVPTQILSPSETGWPGVLKEHQPQEPAPPPPKHDPPPQPPPPPSGQDHSPQPEGHLGEFNPCLSPPHLAGKSCTSLSEYG